MDDVWFESFAGSQGRPDSRGPPLLEVHETGPINGAQQQPPILKASLGPVIPNGFSVAPRSILSKHYSKIYLSKVSKTTKK